MASARMLPIVSSLLAAIEPTWAISFLPLMSILIFLIDSTTFATAFSMPRFSATGLAPAVTFLMPSSKMASASTVAVVVPSPATSDVLLATSFTSWAPRFSYLPDSSTSFATVTPSLVTSGLPNDFSMMTLRPRGPRVTLTARASCLTPSRMRSRASWSYAIFLTAMGCSVGV